MDSRIFGAIWLVATLTMSYPALAGGCCSKPPPLDNPSPPSSQSGQSAAVVQGQYGAAPSLQGKLDKLRNEGLLIDRNYLDPNSARLPEPKLDKATLELIVTASEGATPGLRARAQDDLVKLGFVLLPTAAQLAGMKTYLADMKAATGNKNTQSGETVNYLFANNTIVDTINRQRPAAAAPSQYNNVDDFKRGMRGTAQYTNLSPEQQNLYDSMNDPSLRADFLNMSPTERDLVYGRINSQGVVFKNENRGTPGNRK